MASALKQPAASVLRLLSSPSILSNANRSLPATPIPTPSPLSFSTHSHRLPKASDDEDEEDRAVAAVSVSVSNLAMKVRRFHLREFFSAFKPISAQKGSNRYSCVKFATKEDALAAIAELNGKELMGKPIMLKLKEPPENTGEPPFVS